MSTNSSQLDLNGPGLPPPPGTTPDFNNPSGSFQNLVVMTLVLCLATTSIIVPLRLYIKYFIVKSLQWEDYTSFAGWIGFIAFIGLFFAQLSNGVAIHMWDVPLWKAMRFNEIANIIEIIYMPIICLTKVSILLQLKRIFILERRGHDFIIILALIWLNILFFTACFFLEIFSCVPREALWNPSVTGKCVNLPLSFIVTACINIVSDLSMFALPIMWVWRLQMATAWKFRVAGVFATGVFACVASAMRLVESIKNNDESADQTWSWTPVALCTGEIASGLIVGCLPVMPRLFSHVVAKTRSGSGSRSKKPSRIPTSKSGGQSSSQKHLSNAWQKNEDPYMQRNNYVELKDQSSSKGTTGTSTVITSERDSGESKAIEHKNPQDFMLVNTTFSVTHAEDQA